MGMIQAFDEAFIRFVYENVQGGFLDGVVPVITKFGDKGILWIVLTIALVIACIKYKKLRCVAISCALALIFSGLFCNLILKPMVMRTRPYDLIEIELLVERLSDYSFPSGHTSAAFAFASALWLNNRKFGWIAVLAATIMALTRLYLCVHFPTDVLAGLVLGVICGWIGFNIAKRLIKNKETA